jgi:enterochelin esterase-like enzyme
LVDAHRRLHQPPLERTNSRQRLVEQSWLDRVNAELEASPMGEMVYICPVTPNPRGQARILDDYAAWLETILMPAVRAQLPKLGKLGIAGCSLGGYVASEVYFRKPELFHSLGIVQGAIGQAQATSYGKRLAALAAQGQAAPIHLLSSEQDPYLKATRTLSGVLKETEYPHLLEVLPGPHTQPWLREAGTVATLYWQDRALRSAASLPRIQ